MWKMFCLRIFLFIQIIIFSECGFSVMDFSDDIRKYFLTSTKLNDKLDEFTKKLTNGLLWCFSLNYSDEMEAEVCMRLKHASVLNSATNIIIHDTNTSTHVETKHFVLVQGFVKSEQNSSYITGYISGKYFYGIMRYRNSLFYFDELKRFSWLHHTHASSNQNSIVFRGSNISPTINEHIDTEIHKWTDFANKFRRSYTDEELFKILVGKGKICTLFVLLDYSFLAFVHEFNVDAAVKHAFSTIEEANSLFRSTDFDNDGSPDNIGFSIKYCIVLKAENAVMNLLPKYSKNAIDGRLFLKMFSRYNLLNEVCLGIVFTGQAFLKNIVGISYSAIPIDQKHFTFPIGGICDRPFLENPGINFNILAVSARSTDGKAIPKYIFDMSLSHELGHSFGSDHDNGGDCSGYLMTDHTPKNLDRKHFVFSRCSKKSMLSTIVEKGYCFENEDNSYCGNGRMESIEECDCGTKRDCEEFDACCVPPGQPKSCRIRRDKGFQCHPSQGLCCTSKCQFRDLSIHNLNCVDFQKSCPCKDNDLSCSCGIQGTCVDSTCNSNECVRINMRECVCQEKNRTQKCSTCCLFNNSCLPASILTTKFMEENNFVEKFNFSETTGRGDTVYKKFCNQEGEQCVLFHFREVQLGDYCLLFGKLGNCDKKHECILPEMDHIIYPDIPIAKMRQSGTTLSIYIQCNVLFSFFMLIFFLKMK